MGLRTVLASQVLPALEAVDRSGNRLDNRLLPSCFSYGAPASNERLPEDLLCALWDEAASLSGEPDFGLRAGEQFMSARSFGITGMLAWHSKTAGAALTNASRYAALVIDGSHLNFEHDGQVVSILGSDDPRPKYWSRHYGEAKKQAFLSLLRRSTGLPLVPHLVEFRHAPGMDVPCTSKFSAAG
ncbi:MAG: AraC family transcriptional regulator [Rhodospirillales bacterium]|nr:AraC family transcriptional regulator [Rhodospirillales bacterium]